LRPLAPLRVRSYRLLLAGQSISTAGDAFLAVAMPALLVAQRGGVRALGVILAAYNVARLLTLLGGGALSDRIGPRRVMLLADVARAGLTTGLALLVSGLSYPRWALCALLAALGAGGGIFLPAYSTITPETLPAQMLQAGNALNFASLRLAALGGPLLAGILITRFIPSVAIGLDALSFLASALTLAAMPNSRTAPKPPDGGVAPAVAQTAEPSFGHFLRHSRLLQIIVVVVVVANLPVEGLKGVALPALAFGTLHLGATGYGLLVAAFGVCGLVGNLMAAALPTTRRRGSVALLLLAGDAVAVGALPFVGGGLEVALCLLVWGLANNLRDALYYTFNQQHLPRALLGRGLGVLLFATFSVAPLSALLIGAAMPRLGPVVVFPVSAGLLLLAVAIGLTSPEMRAE
jgi:predicted MFS family arabinose efflux permease